MSIWVRKAVTNLHFFPLNNIFCFFKHTHSHHKWKRKQSREISNNITKHTHTQQQQKTRFDLSLLTFHSKIFATIACRGGLREQKKKNRGMRTAFLFCCVPNLATRMASIWQASKRWNLSPFVRCCLSFSSTALILFSSPSFVCLSLLNRTMYRCHLSCNSNPYSKHNRIFIYVLYVMLMNHSSSANYNYTFFLFFFC